MYYCIMTYSRCYLTRWLNKPPKSSTSSYPRYYYMYVVLPQSSCRFTVYWTISYYVFQKQTILLHMYMYVYVCTYIPMYIYRYTYIHMYIYIFTSCCLPSAFEVLELHRTGSLPLRADISLHPPRLGFRV